MLRTKYLSDLELHKLKLSAMEFADRSQGNKQAWQTWILIMLALATGLRVSELTDVRLRDFDFTRKILKVTRRKKTRKGKERDIVPLTDATIRYIKQALPKLFGESETLSPNFSLWKCGQRGQWTRRALQQAWASAVKRAGLPNYSIHSARHTMAVRLLKQTGNIKMVQQQLGHASIKTTSEMYAQIPFEDQLNALNVMDPLSGG